MADTPTIPVPAPASKPPKVQMPAAPEPPVPPKKRDYLIDAVFCTGCGKFMRHMGSYIVDPSFKAKKDDPTPVFHEECYQVRGKKPVVPAPALQFKLGVVKEAVFRIFNSQLPDKDRKIQMMDA